MTKLSKNLVNQINEHHSFAKKLLGSGLEHARIAGELLIEAKEDIPHGLWGKWITDNCRFSRRTAQSYMRISRNWNPQHVADLSMRGAIKMLQAPKDIKNVWKLLNLYDLDRFIEVTEYYMEQDYDTLKLVVDVLKGRSEIVKLQLGGPSYRTEVDPERFDIEYMFNENHFVKIKQPSPTVEELGKQAHTAKIILLTRIGHLNNKLELIDG